MKIINIFMATMTFGLAISIVLFLYIPALNNNMRVIIDINRYGEGWLELVFFSIVALFGLYGLIKLLVDYRR